MSEIYQNSQRSNQSSNAEVTGNSNRSEVDGGNSRTSYEDGNITHSPIQLIELDELENMDLDDGNIEYPSLSSIKSSGPPNLFINPMGNNQNHEIQFNNPTVVGGVVTSDVSSGSQNTSVCNNHTDKGKAHEPSGSIAENTSVSTSFQNNFTPSAMKSKFAPVAQNDFEDSEKETRMMMENIHRQIRQLLVSDDPDADNKIQILKNKSTTLNGMLTEIRNMAPKDQSVNTNTMMNNHGQNQVLTMMEQNKFKVPMDKIPKFDIEICNYPTQTYQMKALDKTTIVSYRTVEDFIEAFESIFVFYNTNIDKHWDKALKQSFITSMDTAPRDWLLHEIKVNKFRYKCWNDMKDKLIKKYLETYTNDDYVGQLFLLRQHPTEPLMNYLQRYVILLTKAKMQDTHNKAVECFMSLQGYVKTYLKSKLPELRSSKNNDRISCPDPLLPNENLHSLMELLESHTHSVHRELSDRYAAESAKRSKARSTNDKKRTRPEDEIPNEDTSSPPKRVDRREPQRPYQPFTGNPTKSLCGHCKKVEYVPGHQCPERSEYYRRRAEKENALSDNNRTGTFAVRRKSFIEHLSNPDHHEPYTIVNQANVNMVRSSKTTAGQLNQATSDAIEDTEDMVKTLADILKNYNPMSDDDDLMEYVDQSLTTEPLVASGIIENNGKYRNFLCSMLHTTKKRQMIDDNDILNQNPYSPLSPFLLLGTHRQLALIDSGSDISLLSSDLCNKYNITINPCLNIQITLANNEHVPLLGKTDQILIKYNGRNIKHSFFVMNELGNGKQSLFGCDLFSKLGISLSGVAFNWDDNKVLYNDAIVDEQYQPNISNAGTESEHARLLKALEPAIKRNQAIDIREHCPHPLALIKLDTIPNETRARRQYKIAEKLMPVFDETVKEWLKNGVIKPAPPSPWNNPVTFAPKRKGDGTMSWRTCLDVRELNSILLETSLDHYSIKLPSDIFKQATGAAIYSCIDVTTAYLRLPLNVSDQVKTSFQHRNSAYCFISCPYGITFVGSAWSRLLDSILGDLPFCLTYIDDVYCVTQTNDMDLHAKQLGIIIDRLTKNKLILNMAKAHIGKTAIVVLGQTISRQGRSICTKRLTNICDVPYPQHPKALKSCLGMFTYMRDHCPMASKLTWRLDALRNIGDSVPIQWTPELKHDFDTIKEVLASKLVLSPIDPSLPLIVAVDASDHALGTCLFQELKYTQASGDLDDATQKTITKIRYIAFHSRSLSKSERNWHVQRRELAAIAMALKVYDDFLFGRHFILYSDHRSLTYLFTQTPINEHFVDYFDTLLRHSFEIRHLSGLQNVLPDFLSRLYYSDNQADRADGNNSSKVHKQRKGFSLTNAVNKGTSFKPKSIEHYTNNKSTRLVAFAQATHKFSEQNYVIVPEADRKTLLKEIHNESGHFGADNIVKSIRNQNMNWSGILQDAIDIVSSCSTCAKFNIKKKGYSPSRSVYCYLPGDGYVMDLAGPFSSNSNLYTYLLIMVDVCTRFVILKPLVDKTAKSVAVAMIEAFGIIGLPRFFVASDHGAEWANQLHTMLFQSMQIEKRYSTQYHPEGNGISERYVGIVKKTLAKLLNGNIEDWHNYLPICALLINNKISKKLQSSPFSLMYARNMNAPINYYDPQGNLKSKRYMSNEELLKRIDYMGQLVFPAIAEQHQRYTDKLHGKIDQKNVQVNFKAGTYVMHKILHKTNAFAPSYVGPYQVIRQNDGGAYILRDEEGMLMSRNYIASELKAINQEEIVPKSELFEVEAIIQDNGNPQNREYLVKWKNYNKDHNSWVKTDDFTDTEFIIDYWKKVKKDHAGRPVDVKKIINDKRKQAQNHIKNDFAPSNIYREIAESPDFAADIPQIQTNIIHKKHSGLKNPTKMITRQMAQRNFQLSEPNSIEIQDGKRKFGAFDYHQLDNSNKKSKDKLISKQQTY